MLHWRFRRDTSRSGARWIDGDIPAAGVRRRCDTQVDRAERVLFSRQNAQPSHQGELRKRNFACRGGRIAPIASFFHRELTVSAFVMSDSFQTVPRLTSE